MFGFAFEQDDAKVARGRRIQEILAAVMRERAYQDQKWGTLEQHPHEVGAWLTIMRQELREAEVAWCDSPGDHEALQEILQVVAVGCAALEQYGVVERQQGLPQTLEKPDDTEDCPF